MRFLRIKWIVPILLLAAIYLADQIRIGRPDHKYRMTVEVETPAGVRTAAGIHSVRPNRSYGGTGSGSSLPQTKGDALLVDLGGGNNVVALLAYGHEGANFDDGRWRMRGAADPPGGRRFSPRGPGRGSARSQGSGFRASMIWLQPGVQTGHNAESVEP